MASLVLTGCLSSQRYDLSRPVTTQDWLLVWEDPADVNVGLTLRPDFRVRAGSPLFGLAAPLANYLPVYPLGLEPAGDGSFVEDWHDLQAPAMYFLPLYDEQGSWNRSMLVWREQDTSLIAHSFDDVYLQYQSALTRLEDELSVQGLDAQATQVYWSWLGVFVLAQTDEGSYGLFFSDYPVPHDVELPLSFDQLSGRILSEAEIVDALTNLRDFTQGDEEAFTGPFWQPEVNPYDD